MASVETNYSSTNVHPDVSVLSKVEYSHPGIGHFPLLTEAGVAHGFTWGPDSQNMAFRYHAGERSDLVRRNDEFLRTIGMAPLRNTVVLEAYSGNNLVFVNNRINEDSQASQLQPEHGVFTTLPNQPLGIKPADCTASIVHGFTQYEEPFIGIIHAGRDGLNKCFPMTATEEFTNQYKCDLSTVKIGIGPSLSQKHHTIRAVDKEKTIPDISAWDGYYSEAMNGDIQLDVPGLLVAQYLQVGIKPENIQVYDVDTYEAARTGQSFSHRYAVENNDPTRQGRYMLSAQL